MSLWLLDRFKTAGQKIQFEYTNLVNSLFSRYLITAEENACLDNQTQKIISKQDYNLLLNQLLTYTYKSVFWSNKNKKKDRKEKKIIQTPKQNHFRQLLILNQKEK